MRKEVHRTRNIVLKLMMFALVGFLFLGFSPNAYAVDCSQRDEIPWWRFDQQGYCAIKAANEIVSIVRTMIDSPTALITNFPAHVAFNTSPDEMGACGVKIICDQMHATVVDSPNIQGASDSLIQESDCTAAEDTGLDCDFNGHLLGQRASGSLMGVSSFAYETALTEPPPVNLAYYFKHNLQKIPVVNQTAYAQSINYNAFGLEFALQIWEKTRNIAYAMMSVIMLIIGILIITRKKINPQTVVTIQTALPRVVISLVLITFSYPIGAVMIAAMLPMTGLAIRLVGSAIVEDTGRLANMDFLVAFATMITGVIGPGAIGTLIGIVMVFMTLVAFIISIIKIIIINVKMILQVIFAPIQFAIAAIPGQEDQIQKWFKQMLAKMLAVPAIWFMVALAWYFIISPFLNPAFYDALFVVNNPSPITFGLIAIRGSESIGSRTLTILIIPIMAIATMFFAIRADKTVEGFIMGDSGKKKR